MDPRIQAGLIGFCAAVLAASLAGYINYRLMKKKAELDFQQDYESNLRLKREETLKNLYLLSLKLSFTKLDMASGDNAIDKHNDNYDSAHELIAEIMMVLSLYFPDLKLKFKSIEKEANSYWGEFKNYLAGDRSDTTSPDSNFQLALKKSNKCTALIQELKFDIENLKLPNKPIKWN